MKVRSTIYYFLFLAIILGGFASIAQNDYGLKVISWACYIFSMSILIELILTYKNLAKIQVWEHCTLIVFIFLFGLRAAYIHFPYVEWVVVLSALILAVINILNGLRIYFKLKNSNPFLSYMVGAYYASLVLFLFSVLIRPAYSYTSLISGGLAGFFLGIFILGVIFRRNHLLDGSKIEILRFMRSQPDHSSFLLTGFLLISVYTGLNMIGILPPLYTNEVPKAYIELVNEAEVGKEEPVDGRYQYDLYKEELDKFLERHKTEN